jgi:hypothetical protein
MMGIFFLTVGRVMTERVRRRTVALGAACCLALAATAGALILEPEHAGDRSVRGAEPRTHQFNAPYTSKVLSDQQLADIYAFLQTVPKPPDVYYSVAAIEIR